MRTSSLAVGARSARIFLLASCLLGTAACPASSESGEPPAAAGGTGGDRAAASGGTGGSNAPTGGSTGSAGATGGAGAQGTGGSASQGSGGDPGTTGGAGGGAVDAPSGGAGGGDASSGDVSASDVPIALDDPATWPGGAYGKPFIIACPDGASRTACCAHYCGCMSKICGNVGSVKLPKDCMAACIAPDAVQGWDLRCRVYNCFESLNPLAQKDRVAHCEHAGARGAGDTFQKCHKDGEPAEK